MLGSNLVTHTNTFKCEKSFQYRIKMECFSLRFAILLPLLVAVAASPGSKIAKHGCPDECGGVPIPFPFGIGVGCYFETDWFEIVCNKSTNPPIPYMMYKAYRDGPIIIPQRLLSINLDNQTFSIASNIAFGCYNNPYNNYITNTISYSYPSGDAMVLSIPATMNRLFAIGIGTVAQMKSSRSSSIDMLKYEGGGCTTMNLSSFRIPGFCTNVGCCETSIFVSDGANTLSVSVSNLFDQPQEPGQGCYYAFIAQIGHYRLYDHDFYASPKECLDIRVPVMYNWSIRLPSLIYDFQDQDYTGPPICGSNAAFINWSYVYHCRCLQGYRGNPYLQYGCQDINECEDKLLNICEKPEFCLNKDGGFDCVCNHGYHGNGTKSSPCKHDSGPAKLIIDLAIGSCSIISFIILYAAYKIFKRRKHIQERQHNFKKNGGLLLQQQVRANEGVIDRTKIFTEIDLVRATDNFNNTRVLGHGGQGTVYKGMLEDGTIVAVKKSKKVDANQVAQFINEVVILSQINHRNIVKLFGCCLETEVPLLVYEFVPNGTLYQYIHHPSEDFQMTWKERSQIAVECAGAIAYLHSSCSSPIHHRDIKSSNILLDDKYKAKISDFGTSRSISIDMSHVTTHVQGTFGYLDPEFFRSSQFSEKSDVYSFGVVMLELLTSKKPIYIDSFEEARSLAVEFLKVVETDNSGDQLHDIVDPKVLEHCSKKEIEGLLKLIGQCLSLSGSSRPTMKEVTSTLEMISSQYGEIEEGDGTNDHERTISQDGSLNSHEMNITDDSSFSMDIQHFSFDSDCATIVM